MSDLGPTELALSCLPLSPSPHNSGAPRTSRASRMFPAPSASIHVFEPPNGAPDDPTLLAQH
ncbi:hypothetical protein FB451DRAFT_1395743 [Mycena latifolia]|nr:hypothetical protein FB451DRAFT_1395743 [Mycena latifolia]